MRLYLLLILFIAITGIAYAGTNNDRIAGSRADYLKNKTAVGERHTLEIRNGKLWACGRNVVGQLGDGTYIDKNKFVQIGTDNDWVCVAAGANTSFAIKADGTLWAWGQNHRGQLGDSSFVNKNIPVKIGIGNDWSCINTSDMLAFAIKSDGTFWRWGNYTPYPSLADTSKNWTSISVGWTGFGVYQTLGLKSDGSLWTNLNAIPVKVGNDTWVNIAAGGFHGLAIKKDGTLWGWGDNYYGQIGNTSANVTVHNAVQIDSSNDWVDISASRYNSMAIKADGSLWSCGYWGYWVLGRSGDPYELLKVGSDWVSVHVSWFHCIGSKADGTTWTWGNNLYGELGNGTTSIVVPTSISSSDDWVSLAGGGTHSLGVKADGTLWAWGQNDWGQLGDGTNASKTDPIRVGISQSWTHIAAGVSHNLGIKADGTLWAWGLNTYGQLGDGAHVNKNGPSQVDTSKNWVAVSAGAHHSLAIKADGTLWAWGYNYYGELGDSTNGNINTPVQVDNAKNWVVVSAGAHHSLAIKADGTLWAWGYNLYGQLGDSSNINENIPVQIGKDTGWVNVRAGYFHTLAIKADGSLWTWGRNNFGQLGDGTNVDKNAPVRVGVAHNWIDITANSEFSLGIRNDGTLWAWGLNHKGQLGIGTYANKSSPTQVGNADDWVCVAAGSIHTVGINAERRGICATGDNTYGQLGTKMTAGRNIFDCACPGYIYNMPDDTTLCVPGSAYFRIKAKYAFAYQWQGNNGSGWISLNNNANYKGTNTDSLVLLNVTPAYNNYWYRCIIYNDCNDSIVSDSAQLTFGSRPIVVMQPMDKSICASTNGVFEVQATNTPLNYQWQVYNGTNWSNVVDTGIYSGSSSKILQLTAPTIAVDGYRYRCIVSNKCAPADTSDFAVITVIPTVVPTITISGNDTDICFGQTANFTATPEAGGTSPGYQWQINGVNAGTNSASFATSSLTNGALVRCFMTSDIACPSPKTVLSNAISIKVTQNVTPTIDILSDKGNSWCSGKEAIFRSTDTNGGTAPAYQWKINGMNIGPDADTLWMPFLTNGDVVECEMASSHKCPLPKTANSNKITMTIIPTTIASMLIMPNPDSVVCDQKEVTMYCAFTNGGTNPRFQWMLNGVDMPGETNGTLKTTKLKQGDFINCRLISSGVCVFPEVSNPVSFDVKPILNPKVSLSVTYMGNNTHLFTAIPIDGGTNPTYRWYVNGKPLKDEHGSTITLAGQGQVDKVWVEMVSSEECVPESSRMVSSKVVTTNIATTNTAFKTLNLHPNPNNGTFIIEGELATVSADEVNITILNGLGQIVYRVAVQPRAGKLNHTINTGKDLAPGSYMLKLDYGGEQDFKRFVIMK